MLRNRLSVPARLAALLALALPASGCSSASQALDNLLNNILGGPRELRDENAFVHLRRDPSAAPKSDAETAQKIIDAQAAMKAGMGMPAAMMEDPTVEALLRRTIQPRLEIDEDAFDRVDFGRFGANEDVDVVEKQACSYDVDLSTLQDKFILPHVDKIPVRNQAGRGTCASFAGIATLEYAALNPMNPTGNASLPSMDLSEQRFYFNSKKDCQGPSGCECPGCEEGSWYGTGFSNSARASTFDVPLETDCPYNGRVGKNDTQYPQTGSCTKGAVQVSSVESWCGAADLVDYLHRGYAVPWASPLSGNWERNDGLVTKADFDGGGATVHAGGHAYLIVGYRKLPNLPNEGGLCFIIKNSWGRGWGAEGYSCMTLAWMKAVTFDGFLRKGQPIALQVLLRDDLAMAPDLPDEENEEAEDEIPPDPMPDPSPVPDGEELLPPPDPPMPDPMPAPAPAMFSRHKLLGPGDSYFKVMVATSGTSLFVKGIVRKGMLAVGAGADGGTAAAPARTETVPLRVEFQTVAGVDNLYFDGDQVGMRQGKELRICTGEWGSLCALRYRNEDGLLYIQFRDDDLRKVTPEEVSADRGKWLDLSLGGLNYGIFVPTGIEGLAALRQPKTFMRLGDREPTRFSLSREEGVKYAVKLQGIQVGGVDFTKPSEASVCSATYGQTCSLIGKQKLYVIPSNLRKK